jgi:exodeoxyribonuclease VII small subunit
LPRNLQTPADPATQLPDFELALTELEQLVERLERGDLSLDEALKTFERGVELTRHCQTSLKAAQQRVEILLKRNGQTTAEPFSVPEDDSSSSASGLAEGPG